ncbi:unnamed protein product [Polarella glacialis]|uniref:Beta-lactamase-related domain-containing protein n=1 Tax=Polarella glacialis TaxID=89957 RepID=A0A813HLH1_POLGL|nr:unnamed protein product [Polarella glacialis]
MSCWCHVAVTAPTCDKKQDKNQAPDSAESKACHHLVEGVEKGEFRDLAHFIDELAKVPLRAPAGKQYSYSFASDVLGRVVEIASGKSLGEYLKQELFGPLGMHDTGFSFPKSKGSRLAAVFGSRQSAMDLGAKASSLPKGSKALCRLDRERPEESRWSEGRRCKVESGGGSMGANMGGLVSTVADCSRFLAMLSQGGALDGVRVLEPDTVAAYCLPDLLPNVITSGKKQRANGSPFGWTALGEVGVARTKRDTPANTKDDFEIGEVGGGGAACTYWSINPNRDLATVWFTQLMDNDPYVKEEENIYLAARLAVPKSGQSDLHGNKQRKLQQGLHCGRPQARISQAVRKATKSNFKRRKPP